MQISNESAEIFDSLYSRAGGAVSEIGKMLREMEVNEVLRFHKHEHGSRKTCLTVSRVRAAAGRAGIRLSYLHVKDDLLIKKISSND